MADPQHLDLLKQGKGAWNSWRAKKSDIRPDLSHANLSHADLSHTDLSHTDLSAANLYGVYFYGANLIRASLSSANLSTADLDHAELHYADLTNANLNGANFSKSFMMWTVLGELDLRFVKGLETVIHEGPSHLAINTVYLSHGEIPEVFVRGTGAPDSFIEHLRSLAAHPIEYYTCFISYSGKDRVFAEQIYADLQSKGVRCWFAPEDLKIGDKFRQRIDESIRFYDKLLLVLSAHSVASPWVEKEVETAFEKEHRTNRLVLFPVKLDESIMQTDCAWAADIRRVRHIGDFTRWKEHDAYQKVLERLLRDLKTDATKDTQ